MYFIIIFFVALWLGYKLKTLVDFINVLKIKNYVEVFAEKYENSKYKVLNEKKKSTKVEE